MFHITSTGVVRGEGVEYSVIWPMQGFAAGQVMVFVLSVLNRVYNFMQVSPVHYKSRLFKCTCLLS